MVGFISNHIFLDTKKAQKTSGLKGEIKAKKDKKVIQQLCRSIERIVDGYRKFNQDFVAMLIPLKLCVPVVTNILGYNDNLILLKTKSLNTLSEVVMRGVHNISSDLHENIEGGQEKSNYIDNHRIDSKLHGKLLAKFKIDRTIQKINFQE